VIPAVGISAILVIHGRASRGLRKRVEGKSRDLRELAFDPLAVMEGAEADRAEYTTTGAIEVLVNRTDPDTLRVLVRGWADVLFYTLIRCDGFHATREGRVRPMEDTEYDEFE
jgi:hypothetical protein